MVNLSRRLQGLILDNPSSGLVLLKEERLQRNRMEVLAVLVGRDGKGETILDKRKRHSCLVPFALW